MLVIDTNVYNIPEFSVMKQNRTGFKLPLILNDKISFTSRNLLDKNPKEITEIVRKAISDYNNLLGQGYYGYVFDIPKTGYCVKVQKKISPTLKKWNFKISKKERLNHVVAKSDNETVIMQKIQGITVGKLNDKTKKEIYKLPLDSYKDLILQIDRAYRSGLSIDSSEFNVIYNKGKKSLTQIDFFYSREPYSPFFEVFRELACIGNIKQRVKLAENLLNLATREISTNNKDNLPLIRRDLMRLYKHLDNYDYVTPNINKHKKYIEEHLTKYKKIIFFFAQLKNRMRALKHS